MRRWLLLLPIIAYLATGLTAMRPGEIGVVRRFGRVVATPGPGLWVGWPWGFERVDHVAVDRVRRVVVGDDEPLLTGDQNLVRAGVAIDYTVRAYAVAEYVTQRERIDAALVRVTNASVAEWLASRPVDDALMTGKTRLPPWLLDRVRDRLETYRLGIDVRAASVSELAPPDEVRGAFDAVTRAQASIRTREQEAGLEAERLRRSAESTKYALEQQSTANAHAALAAGRADADSFRTRSASSRVLTAIWWAELGPLFAKMQAAGRVQLLDERLGADGMDVLQTLPGPKK